MTPKQRATIEAFEARVAAEERTYVKTNFRYGPERGMVVTPDGKVAWQGSSNESAHISNVPQEELQRGSVMTHFHPDTGDAWLSSADIEQGLRTGVTTRCFTASGHWQEFIPSDAGIGKSLGITSEDLFATLNPKPSLDDLASAMTAAHESVLGDKGVIRSGGPARPGQKGDVAGHGFHGNRFTGGIGGSGDEATRMHPAKLTVEEMRAFGQILQKDAAPPKEIKQQEYMMLAGKFLMAEQDADNVATTTAGERTPEFLAALRFEELKETMGEYETADAWLLNMELRGGTDPAELSMSSHSVAEMDEAVKEFGQHFDEDKVVFRGAIMDHIPQVGEVYHDEAFVSTIPDAYEAVNCCSAGYANVVSMQAAPVDGASVVWEINIPAGTDVVAARPSEYKESSPFLEVLLGRGANLRVEQTGTRKGVTFVKATYLGSQPKPLAPRSRKAAAPAAPSGRAWRVLWLPGDLKTVEAGEKGDTTGHAFHGNRYTGGIGGGEHGHATFTSPPEELGRLGTATLLAKRAEAEKAGGLTHEWGGTNEQAFVSNLKRNIQMMHSHAGGLTSTRIDSFTKTWARSSTDTVADSVAMQQAIADKFNVPMGSYLQERAAYLAGGYKQDLLTVAQVNEIGRSVKAFIAERNQQFTGRTGTYLDPSVPADTIRPPEGYGVEGTRASEEFFAAVRQQAAMLEPLERHNSAIEAAIQNGEDFSAYDMADAEAEGVGKSVEEFRPDTIDPHTVDFTAYEQNGIRTGGDLRLMFDGNDIQNFEDRIGDARQYVDAVYAQTQEQLKEWGVKYLALDRGMSLKETAPKTFTKIDFDANPLSSWSADTRVALRFAYHDVTSSEDSPNPWWLKSVVPVEKVFSLPFTGPGCYNENEVVCIKGDYDVLATQGPIP